MIAVIISSLVAIFASGYFVAQRNGIKKQRDKKKFDDAADEYFKSIGVTGKKDNKNDRGA